MGFIGVFMCDATRIVLQNMKNIDNKMMERAEAEGLEPEYFVFEEAAQLSESFRFALGFVQKYSRLVCRLHAKLLPQRLESLIFS